MVVTVAFMTSPATNAYMPPEISKLPKGKMPEPLACVVMVQNEPAPITTSLMEALSLTVPVPSRGADHTQLPVG